MYLRSKVVAAICRFFTAAATLLPCLSYAQTLEPSDTFAAGLRYFRGEEVEKDARKAAELFDRSCNGKVAEACWALGLLHMAGEGVPQDQARAAILFSLACDGQIADACYLLGDQHFGGIGVPKDERTAASFFEKGCAGENLDACFALASMYKDGVGVPESSSRSRELLEAACERSHGKSCFDLALLFRDGDGVETDVSRALTAFEAACLAGVPEGCSYLGAVHGAGLHDVSVDYRVSAEYHSRACDGGVAFSCSILASYYSEGLGVNRSASRALQLYWDSCVAGYPAGCRGLGRAYEEGDGIPRNPASAASAYERGCSLGDGASCYYIAALYERGEGVPPSSKDAAAFYEKGCSFDDGDACNNSGLRLEDRGDAAKALDFYTAACENNSASGCFNAARMFTGADNAVGKDLTIANRYFQRACELGDADGCAAGSSLNIVTGDWDAAERLATTAVALLQSEGTDGEREAVSIDVLGKVLTLRGDASGAEAAFRTALELRRKLGHRRAIGTSLAALASIAAARADWAAASDLFQQALTELHGTPLSDVDHGSAIGGAIAALLQGGYHSQALELLTSYQLRYEKSSPNSLAQGSMLAIVAFAAEERGDIDLALRSAREAWSILALYDADTFIASIPTAALARVAARRGHYEAAEIMYTDLLHSSLLRDEHSAVRADTLLRLARLKRRRCDLARSEELLGLAISLFERQRALIGGSVETIMRFAARYDDLYRELEDVLTEKGDTSAAFQMVERRKAYTLAATLSHSALSTETGNDRHRVLDAEYDRTFAELSQIGILSDSKQAVKLRIRLREIADEQFKLRQRVAEDMSANSVDGGVASATDALTQLDRGTILLSYSVGTAAARCFVLFSPANDDDTPSLYVFDVPASEEQLAQKIQRFRALIQHAEWSVSLEEASRDLYSLLIAPVESLIDVSRRIAISKDGPLNSLPFGALLSDASDKYLIERRPLHLVASATVFLELQRQRAPIQAWPTQLLGFADPVYSSAATSDTTARGEFASLRRRGFTFQPLPGTRRELSRVAALFGEDAAVYFGADATEERATSNTDGARYLHFACHAVLDEHFPLNSALVLSVPSHPDTDAGNGLLQAREIIRRMSIRADLVVLSACDTSLGTEFGGEGLFGLTRAFQLAGATSVVGSIWSVADDATAELMERMYVALTNGAPKDIALQAAQVSLIRQRRYSHPFFWAAFELSGDWQ